MLSVQILLRAERERRCVTSGRALAPHEALVCETAFPGLYAGLAGPAEIRQIKEILRTVPAAMAAADASPSMKDSVRAFMSRLVRCSDAFREDALHRYLFDFWAESYGEADQAVILGEKYFECDAGESETEFARTMLPYFRKEEAWVDVLALNPQGRTLFLIEVKLEGLDDRAVGQLLRYYAVARRAIDRPGHHCDIRRVVPVVVLKTIELRTWDALPVHFRELLHIYLYTSDVDRVVLRDGKRHILSQVRERLFATL